MSKHLERALNLMTQAVDELAQHQRENNLELRPELVHLLTALGELVLEADPKRKAGAIEEIKR